MTAHRSPARHGPTRRLALLATALLPGALLPSARSWAAPRGKVILSVTGTVSRPTSGDRADFDLATLDALPQREFTMNTPWYKGPRRFSGPLLRDVLAAAGARGQLLQAVALNNYKVDIPFDDVERFDVMLATRLDGQPMAVRDKGPLFIVYPFHESATLRSERYYSRSAWQLRTLEVK